jgi:uncharacterized metal-binding protein
MPSGAVHNGVTVLSTVAVAGGLLALGTPGDVVIGIAVGQLAGLTMTPDMDVDRGNRTDTLVRAVAPPLEVLWDAYWWPYRKLFKHRGVSHTPIFGTLTRVLYTYRTRCTCWLTC